MSARDAILSAIRAAAVPAAPPAAIPSLASSADVEQLRGQFLQLLEQVGGRGVTRASEQPLEPLIADVLGADRDGAMVIHGRFAVAENAAVYVDAADLRVRNDVVRAEHLVVVVPAHAVVPTMHEAMRAIPSGSTCGWFLSGPSKTADIEQSLVFGAQGSRTHTVIFDADSRESQRVNHSR